MSDLATLIELLRRLDTSREVQILLSLNCRARPEEESNLMWRYEIDIPIDSVMCLPPYHPPRQCEEECHDEKRGEEFTHAKKLLLSPPHLPSS
jgi:hypothetical protein